ncbi:MAG TPA: hypothetical protein VKR56_07685 [Candidatus Cybelea sp.]|nr:hypothetical protein [Candidatus Cybelea sp.]
MDQPVQSLTVKLLLADYAVATEGKITIVGGGWRNTLPMSAIMAIGGTVEIPWTETNRRHHLRIALVRQDGQAVRIATPIGEQAFELQGAFEAGRPPGVPPGTSFTMPLALSFVRPQLEVGTYVFDVFVGDARKASLPFDVLEQLNTPHPRPPG